MFRIFCKFDCPCCRFNPTSSKPVVTHQISEIAVCFQALPHVADLRQQLVAMPGVDRGVFSTLDVYAARKLFLVVGVADDLIWQIQLFALSFLHFGGSSG